jgi:hypothetical protein
MKNMIGITMVVMAVMLGVSVNESSAGPRITVIDHYRPTPEQQMREAAAAGDLRTIRRLADSGTNINGVDYDGWTALVWATMADEPEAVKLLLEKGADVNVADKLRRTPLYWASMEGNTEIMDLLLARGAALEAKEKKRGWTSLMRATSKGQTEAVELLLSKGADPNAKDRKGNTALALAYLDDRKDTAKVLLAGGAKPDKKVDKILAAADNRFVAQAFQQTTMVTYANGSLGGAPTPQSAALTVIRSEEAQRGTIGGPAGSSGIHGGGTQNRNHDSRSLAQATTADLIKTGISVAPQTPVVQGAAPNSPERAELMLRQAVVLWQQITREYPDMAKRLQDSARRAETR